MKRNRFVDVIYTHTEGEPTCIVHAGITYPAVGDILETRAYLEANYDWLRRALMREPRGHSDMFGVFLTPPTSAEADAGMIWMDGSDFRHMCGHGTIALGMAMVANGLVAADGPVTNIRFETTAGPVTAEVGGNGDAVEWCRLTNVPSYVAARDIPLDLPDLGPVTADIAFGGNFFALIDIAGRNLPIGPENGTALSRLGVAARHQIAERVSVQHPIQSHIDKVDFVTFYHGPSRPEARYRCVHVFGEGDHGQLDRSPGGTGTSAMMALFAARGELSVGDCLQSEGLLGSGTFEGCVIDEVELGEHRAIVPTIKGTANIVGYAKWLFDPDDPVGAGFVVS